MLPQIIAGDAKRGAPAQKAVKVQLPSIVPTSPAKNKGQRKDKMTKQKILPKIHLLEKSMDSETLDQLHKLLRGSQLIGGDLVVNLASTVPTSRAFESKLCSAFHQAFMENNAQRQSIVLQQLGDLYRQRAREERQREDAFSDSGADCILKAVSAYSAALNRTLHSEQRDLLFSHITDTVNLYINTFRAKQPFKSTDTEQETPPLKPYSINSDRYKRKIEKLREFVRKRQNRLYELWKHKLHFNSKHAMRGQDFETTKEALNLANKVKSELKLIYREIILDCVERLGVAPCKFAIVAVGDLASGYATPFSDFQYIILTEKEMIYLNSYFSYLANLIHIEVLLLGETPLTATSLKLIHDPLAKNINVLFDDSTLSGIKIDVGACANSVNPFVFKYSSHIEESDQDLDLIKTPAQMVRFMYMLHDHGYHEFALTLYQHVLICGDADLVASFRSMIEENFVPKEPSTLDERMRTTREHVARLAAEQYSINYFVESLGENTQCDLGYIVSDIRALPLLFYAMKLIYGLSAKQPALMPEELRGRGLITEDTELNLKLLLSVMYLLSVRASQIATSQFVNQQLLRPSDSGADSDGPRAPIDILKRLFGLTSPDFLLRTYAVLIPLSRAIQSYHSVSNPLPSLKLDFRQPDLVYVEVNYRLMRYGDALDALRAILSTSSPPQPHTLFEPFELLNNLGCVALRCGQSSLAGSIFAHALEMTASFPQRFDCVVAQAVVLLNMGTVNVINGEFEKSEKYYKKSLEEYQSIDLSENSDCYYIRNLFLFYQAMYHTCVGRLSYSQGNIQKALQHFNLTLDCMDTLPLATNIHVYSWKRLIAFHLIDIHSLIGEFKYARAVVYHMTESDMKRFSVVSPVFAFIQDVQSIACNMRQSSKQEMETLYAGYAARMIDAYFAPDCALEAGDLWLCGAVDVRIMLRQRRNAHALLKTAPELESHSRLAVEHHSLGDTCCGFQLEVEHVRDVTEHCQALMRSGCYQEALEEGSKAAKLLSKLTQSRRHSVVHARLTYCIGLCQLSLGNLDEAVRQFNLASGMYKTIFARRTIPAQTDILQHKAECFRKMKKYEESLRTWEECILLRRQVFGNLHQVVAQSYRRQGLLLHELMDYDMAQLSLQTALKMYKILSGKGALSVADVYFDMGRVCNDMLEANKAEQHLTRALEIYRHAPSGSSSVCEVLSYLGSFYRQKSRLEAAIEHHTEAIRCSEEAHGELAWPTARNYAELAEDLQASELYDNCIEAFEKALSIHEDLGSNAEQNLQVANWLRELGRAYEVTGVRDKALVCQRRSIALKEQCMGKAAADADLLDSLVKLAERNEQKADFARAIPLRRQFLKQQQLMAAADFPNSDTINAMWALSRNYLEVREFEHSLIYNQQLLETIRASKLEEKQLVDLEIADVVFFRGCIYDQMGRVYKAIKLYREALDKFRALQRQGESVLEKIVTTMISLGNILTIAGQQESESVLKGAIDALQCARRDTNRKVLLSRAYHYLGESFESHPRYGRAVQCHERALRLRRELYKGVSAHGELAESLRALGKAKCCLGHFSEGIPLLVQALHMLKLLNQPTKQYAHALLEIGRAFSDSDKSDMGLDYLFQALRLFKEIYGGFGSHFYIARSYEYIAEACAKANKHEDALGYADTSLKYYQDILKYIEDHPVFAHLNDVKGNVFMAMGRYKEAVFHYKKASQMFLAIHNESIVTWDVQQAMAKYKNARAILESTQKTKEQS